MSEIYVYDEMCLPIPTLSGPQWFPLKATEKSLMRESKAFTKPMSFPPANIWLMLEIQFEKNSDKIKNWFIELTSSLFASVFFANSLSRDLDQLSQGLNCSNINGRHESYASFSLICRHVSGVSTENRSSQIFSNLKGQFDVIEVITKTRSECFSLTLLAKASVPNRSEIFPNSATQSGQEILGLKMCCK